MAQLPAGGAIASGQAAISARAGILNVNQTSQQAIINWQSFSIGAGQTTRFAMPNGGSVLNRVTGSDVSAIMGNLQANGNVFLINPHGVLIGNGARINVGSLTASTLSLSDQNFLNGDTLNFGGGSSASVQNFGEITSLGDVFLIGRNVSNAGVIKGSHVGLAAGGSVELRQLDPDNPGLERLSVHASGNETPSQVGSENKAEGIIEATTAELKAAGGNIYALAVNNGGVVRANSIVKEKGRIYLKAEGGTVVNSGALDVAGKGAGVQGGDVQVLGQNVGLAGNSVIDASGDAGGGEVLIGGDYQGKNSAVLNADYTVMTSGSSINASATGQGDGGRVILWSDYTTKFLGEIEARGAGSGGDGGFVETSGKNTLTALGSVDVSSANGAGGQWLLDPRNITIVSGLTTANEQDVRPDPETEKYDWDDAMGEFWLQYRTTKQFTTFGGTPDDSIVDVTSIETALNAGGSVWIQTEGTGSQFGDITIDAAITKTSHGAKDTSVSSRLGLQADRDIIINQPISATGAGANLLSLSLGATRNVKINADLTGLKVLDMWRPGSHAAEEGAFGVPDVEEWVRRVDIGTATAGADITLSAEYMAWSAKETYINPGSAAAITATTEFNLAGDLILRRNLTVSAPKVMIGEGDLLGDLTHPANKYNVTIDTQSLDNSTGTLLMGSPDYPGFRIKNLNNFTHNNGKFVGLGYGKINIGGKFSLDGSLMVPFHVDINAGSKGTLRRLIVTEQLALDLGADADMAKKIAASEQTVTINTSSASDRSAPSGGGEEGGAGDPAPASGEGDGGTPSEEAPNN